MQYIAPLIQTILWVAPRRHYRMTMRIACRLASAVCAVLAAAFSAEASVGLAELPPNTASGPLTVFYPTDSAARTERRGTFNLLVAVDATLTPGNRRLIVISHGSPASPWVYFDLAQTLVAAGFVVVLPEHFADNYKDDSEPGPPSWKRRPMEVTRSIDRIGAEPRFAPALDLDRVGMYGMSAGGHTALTLAGGRWSPSRLRLHCQEHIEQDFHACAGPTTALTGGFLDRIKISVVRAINDRKLDDTLWYEHKDSRIAAIVSGVPFAADFDLESLSSPSAPLAIISAQADKWLAPQFHSDAVLRACRSCEQIARLPTGGHGALLSPLPAGQSGSISALIADPPGFNRASVVPMLNEAITAYFRRRLLDVAK